MSLTRRLVELAQANLTTLLDKVAQRPAHERRPIGDLSDDELEAELERRKTERTRRTAPVEPPPPRPRADGGRQNRIAEYYALLEVPYGADLKAVKQAFRRLMRKHHPDLKGEAERAKALSHAYSELERALRR